MINFIEINDQIQKKAALAPRQNDELERRRETAWEWYCQAAENQDDFKVRLEAFFRRYKKMRGSVPRDEAMLGEFCAPQSTQPVSVLAVDGSHVEPNRSAPMDYAIINIGVVGFPCNGGRVFQQAHSELLTGEDLSLNEFGIPDAGSIKLRRDLAERVAAREYIYKNRSLLPDPLVCLTDGQLILWKMESDPKEYDEKEKEYIAALNDLALAQIITAGYVDDPRSNYIIRALEIVHYDEDDPPVDNETGAVMTLDKYHPLSRVCDQDLFWRFLKPGERSAVFTLQSATTDHYQGDIAICFFYINVGQPGQNTLARVDIPAWVANNKEQLDMLQSALLAQCRISGNKPFPYALHRAHEVGTFTFAEREQVDAMLAKALRERGYQPRRQPRKQAMKDLGRSGRS